MKIKCPTCKKECTWENNPTRPFCSERCKLIDLGEWGSDGYALPSSETPSSDRPAPSQSDPKED